MSQETWKEYWIEPCDGHYDLHAITDTGEYIVYKKIVITKKTSESIDQPGIKSENVTFTCRPLEPVDV